ncbi:uncharacterized protein LOC143769954 [Ranitomeya variabilis]|uniref:uncharacterized protein LOC143769954 n=1 Tax=Ranitomeya variabilis TaxID=490064 RepID=UPI0040576367
MRTSHEDGRRWSRDLRHVSDQTTPWIPLTNRINNICSGNTVRNVSIASRSKVTFLYVMGWSLLRWCLVWSSCGFSMKILAGSSLPSLTSSSAILMSSSSFMKIGCNTTVLRRYFSDEQE